MYSDFLSNVAANTSTISHLSIMADDENQHIFNTSHLILKSTAFTINPNILMNKKEAAKFLGITVSTFTYWKCVGRYDLK